MNFVNICFITIFIVLSTSLSHKLLVDACSCVKTSKRDVYCSSSFVAILFVKSQMDCFEWHSCYEVVVKRLFKPSSPKTDLHHHRYHYEHDSHPPYQSLIRELISANTTASCGQEFQVGVEYFVMGDVIDSGDGVTTKAEVYSCSYPIIWSSLSYNERRELISDVKPSDGCKKKRKRVL